MNIPPNTDAYKSAVWLVSASWIVVGGFVASNASAQGRPPLPVDVVNESVDVEVSNEPGESLTVTVDNQGLSIAGEVEVKNDNGNPLDVDGTVIVTNNQPIDVIERPGNANYTRRINSPFVVQGSPFSVSSTIFAASHMQGLTVSSVARGDITHCDVSLKYPDNAALRPVNQGDPEFMKVSLAAPVDSIHIPLADLFVGENVALTYTFSAFDDGGGGDCKMTTVLQLRPLPVPILP
jgi:hypothetical protein